MLTLTDNVVRKFKEFLETEWATDSGIRIFVSGGC
jgi:Fe-S cluster assembly iron-binding protein IscA